MWHIVADYGLASGFCGTSACRIRPSYGRPPSRGGGAAEAGWPAAQAVQLRRDHAAPRRGRGTAVTPSDAIPGRAARAAHRGIREPSRRGGTVLGERVPNRLRISPPPRRVGSKTAVFRSILAILPLDFLLESFIPAFLVAGLLPELLPARICGSGHRCRKSGGDHDCCNVFHFVSPLVGGAHGMRAYVGSEFAIFLNIRVVFGYLFPAFLVANLLPELLPACVCWA